MAIDMYVYTVPSVHTCSLHKGYVLWVQKGLPIYHDFSATGPPGARKESKLQMYAVQLVVNALYIKEERTATMFNDYVRSIVLEDSSGLVDPCRIYEFERVRQRCFDATSNLRPHCLDTALRDQHLLRPPPRLCAYAGLLVRPG